MFEAVIQADAEAVHFELAGETAAQPGVTRYGRRHGSKSERNMGCEQSVSS